MVLVITTLPVAETLDHDRDGLPAVNHIYNADCVTVLQHAVVLERGSQHQLISTPKGCSQTVNLQQEKE